MFANRRMFEYFQLEMKWIIRINCSFVEDMNVVDRQLFSHYFQIDCLNENGYVCCHRSKILLPSAIIFLTSLHKFCSLLWRSATGCKVFNRKKWLTCSIVEEKQSNFIELFLISWREKKYFKSLRFECLRLIKITRAHRKREQKTVEMFL